jgi:hypothetical protein
MIECDEKVDIGLIESHFEDKARMLTFSGMQPEQVMDLKFGEFCLLINLQNVKSEISRKQEEIISTQKLIIKNYEGIVEAVRKIV